MSAGADERAGGRGRDMTVTGIDVTAAPAGGEGGSGRVEAPNAHDLSRLTSPEADEVTRDNGIAVIPLGSVEQHGPHLPNGTDTIAAELVARAVAARLGALYVPFAPYGVTPIHAGWPGTISLRRETFEALLTDVCTELTGLGTRAFVLVNWHEGNIASMDAVATKVQAELGATFVSAQACYVAQRLYREQGGELTHGGGIEALAVMAHDASLVRLDRAGEPHRPPGAAELDEMRRSREVYGYVTDVGELTEEGWYGEPHWAKPDLAAEFADTVADGVVELVESVLKARQRSDDTEG
ncbi:MAG: creatininase family protein [Streptosporangiales bacterium]|nr:creatininase family protein [Streptosporangiales bacterium]